MKKIIKHKHHIIPKHMGGLDTPENLIELSIDEHAEAHRKLYERYGKWQDKVAWLSLSKQIDTAERHLMIVSAPKSEEFKIKMLGNKNASGNKGKPKTDKHKRKIAESKKGKPRPDLIGNKYAKALKGRKKSKEHQDAINRALNSAEVKEKISLARKNKKIVKCPYCGTQGKEGGNMKRYHFHNCKEKNNATRTDSLY